MATTRPDRASAREVARPIPREAPVTKATVGSSTRLPRAGGGRSGPSEEVRPPGEPTPEGGGQDEVARLELAVSPRPVERDGDGRGGGVPDLGDVDHHTVRVDA